MRILYIRVTTPCILVAPVERLEGDMRMEDVLLKLSVPFVQKVAYEVQGVIPPWGEALEQEIKELIAYAEKNKKKFWWLEEKHLSREELNQKAPLVQKVETVWKKFKNIP